LRRSISILTALSCFVILNPMVGEAKLWERELQNMETAFMTGYFRALHLDIETISRLKEDKQAMKKYIRAKAREYMDEVRKLNR
jgi:hypothetical protein